jgi:regulator of replication initiation timing
MTKHLDELTEDQVRKMEENRRLALERKRKREEISNSEPPSTN